MLATFFGIGLLPWCPGTWGALAGLVLGILLKDAPLAIVMTVLFCAGVWVSQKTAEAVGNKDPSEVVIDEVVGMGVAMLFLPRTLFFCIAAFALFRLFDIWKPGVIRRFESAGGGLGIMLDDLAAGIFANLILQSGHLIYLLAHMRK